MYYETPGYQTGYKDVVEIGVKRRFHIGLIIGRKRRVIRRTAIHGRGNMNKLGDVGFRDGGRVRFMLFGIKDNALFLTEFGHTFELQQYYVFSTYLVYI